MAIYCVIKLNRNFAKQMMEYQDLFAIVLSTNRLQMAIKRDSPTKSWGYKTNQYMGYLGYSGIQLDVYHQQHDIGLPKNGGTTENNVETVMTKH